VVKVTGRKPAEVQTVAETHETPASSCPDAGLAVAWRCQVPPEKCSASAEALFPDCASGPDAPAAVQVPAETHQTPYKTPAAGLAIAWTAHVLREKCSASGPLLLPEIPTAVQLSAVVHETP
jgi:hypothetical protein